MKNLLVVALISSAFTSVANAESGKYVCAFSAGDADSVANALNSLSCDMTKPFSVSDADNAVVCCVQK